MCHPRGYGSLASLVCLWYRCGIFGPKAVCVKNSIKPPREYSFQKLFSLGSRGGGWGLVVFNRQRGYRNILKF